MAAPELEKEQPPWLEWVLKNSQPKNYCYPKPKLAPSRWRKKGPMKQKDWKRFFKWCATKCNPVDHTPKPPEPEYDKKGRPILPQKPQIDEEAQKEADARLAQPKFVTEKFPLVARKPGPFRPTFDPKKPAKIEKGRPFKQPKVPCCFPNDDIEGFFWATYRFLISKNAKKAKARPRTIQLAKPKVIPPAVPHCEIPVVLPEVIQPRTKMTYKQWKAHLRRLEYLARPKIYVEIYGES